MALIGGNPYAGGQEYRSGTPLSNADLYFVEGTRGVPAVPEPSALAPFACDGLGLTARRRRTLKETPG